MEIIGILLLCGVVSSLTSIPIERNEICKQMKFWTVCKTTDELLSVNSTSISSGKESDSRELLITEQNVSSIAANAFKNLSISSLELVLAPKMLSLMPESFNGLPNLKKLVIMSGTIELESNSFSAVRYLEHLQMSIIGDQPKFVAALSELKNLKSLKVINRKPSGIDVNTFPKNFPPISELRLEYVNLSSIEPKSFIFLKNLEILTIMDNSKQLTSLQPGIFYGLEKLQVLTIVAPNLVTVPRNVFNDLKKCQWLVLLSDNRMEIEDGAFENSKIENLFVSQKENMPLDKTHWGLTNSTRLLN